MRGGGATALDRAIRSMEPRSRCTEYHDQTHAETPFAAQYARARELGYQKMADEILDIADETGDHHRSRLRVDTLPKIYGDRLEVDAKPGLVVVEKRRLRSRLSWRHCLQWLGASGDFVQRRGWQADDKFRR